MTIHKNVAYGLNPDSAARPPDSLFDLTDLLRMLRVRREIILGTAATVLVLTIIYLLEVTPIYSARAVVMLDQRANKVVDVSAIIAGLPADPTTIQNQVEILHSRSLMNRVVDRLRLDHDAEFAQAGPSILRWINPLNWFGEKPAASSQASRAEDRRNGLIDNILGHEKITVQGESTAIAIDFGSSSADKSAAMANAIADAYVEDQLNAKFEATQKTSQWLSDRLQQLSGQVQAAEAAVQQYKADHNINETAAGSSVVQDQMAQLNGQLILAKSELAEQEAKYKRVLDLQRTGHSDDVSQVVASPLIAQLREQETDLIRQEAELNSRYGPRHPKILDLEAEKKDLLAKIDDEVRRVIETVANDVAVARAHVGSLEGSLNDIEGQTSTQNRAEVKLRQLEVSATSSRSLYEAFLSRFKETQGQEGIETPDARVISRAEVPKAASFPNTQYTLGIAIPAGLFLGILIAMLAERLDAGFRTNLQVEEMLGVPVLATLPEMPGMKSGRRPADDVVDRPLGSYAEAVRGLQIGVSQSNVDEKPKVILVASSVPDEGKTTVALSLARLAARTGLKVVLVDADLRRPSIAKLLGLPQSQQGIVEYLSGEPAVENNLIQDPRSPVQILAANKAASPPDLLGSSAMERLVASLSELFDMVVIDSAPLLPVNDTRVLARLAQAVVFVVRWEKTPREAVVNAARVLAEAQARVAGVVLTRADPGRYRYYAYGYQNYRAYHRYYDA